jgi:hypothetical protein
MLMFGAVFSAPVNHKLQDSTVCSSCSTNFSQDNVETCGFVLFLNKYWNTVFTEEQLYSRKKCEKSQPDECALFYMW